MLAVLLVTSGCKTVQLVPEQKVYSTVGWDNWTETWSVDNVVTVWDTSFWAVDLSFSWYPHVPEEGALVEELFDND